MTHNLTTYAAAERGADNLLLDCLQLKGGESALLVLEPDETLYEASVGQVIEKRLRELGARVTVVTAPLITHPDEFPDTIAVPMRSADHTIFLSRVGDYARFIELPGEGTKTTSYTINHAMLASPYATTSNRLMSTLCQRLELALLNATEWRISCPLGTELAGSFNWPSASGFDDDDFLVRLFPVSTFKPVPCSSASGRVALSKWLMPGAAAKLESALLQLKEPVFCDIDNGNISGFSGPAATAALVSAHYDRVASTLKINRNRVHSWHLGINPQTFFQQNANDDLERWSAISFGSPRYLHFHTCGDEPPGEVAWSLFNPTVHIDGETFWRDGEFVWLQKPDNRQLINNTPGAEALLQPSLDIGV